MTETAYEGLYYVRAARTAMDLDPGPELPPLPGQQRAGAVTEAREVDVEGHRYGASPNATGRNTHYYPGGMVAGRPVPRGWYSEPWWRPALVAGAWGVGLGAPVHLAVQRDVRAWRTPTGSPTAWPPTAWTAASTAATRVVGDGGDPGGDWGGDFGGGDFGGDWGGGDFF